LPPGSWPSPVKFGFRDKRDRKVKKLKMGDRLDLRVKLPDGYTPGDLLHVSLAACMAWILRPLDTWIVDWWQKYRRRGRGGYGFRGLESL